jgi:PhzF family phenazine biosynthesis protein
MMRLAVKQVDAFTSEPFTGNPAAVVSDASGLDARQMQAIAREMNVSETVFVLPATDPAADLQIRWFTPTTEVNLCGHATIACFHALAEEGRHGLGDGLERTLRVQTRSGTLPVRVTRAATGRTAVWFGLPLPDLRPCRLDREILAELLGTHPGAFDPGLSFAEFYSYAVIPLRGLEALQRLSPDSHGLARLSRETGVWGFCPVTLDTVDPGSRIHIRFFAPSEGIGEDPVTGSAHGPLGVWLWKNGVLRPRDGVLEHVGEQGDGIGHRGRVWVRVMVRGERAERVEVGGEAVTVLEGTLRF